MLVPAPFPPLPAGSMSFPSSRTAAVETLLPPQRKAKRKFTAPHKGLDGAWRPMPIEHAVAAERRRAHLKTLETRIQRAAMHTQHQLLPKTVPFLNSNMEGNCSDGLASSVSFAQANGNIRAIFVPHAGVLEQVVKWRLGDVASIRIPSSPAPSTAPGGAGSARAAMLASVGSQLLALYPSQTGAGDEEASKALGAGDLSVLFDVKSSRGYNGESVSIVLVCPSLDQAVADVVFSLQEALTPPQAHSAATDLILLAECPTTDRWLESPLELRTRVKDIHWQPCATAHQEVDLFLTFLLGLKQPDKTHPLPIDIQEPHSKWRCQAGAKRVQMGLEYCWEEEDVSVPLSYPALQLCQALAELAPPGQALQRAAGALALALQHHFFTEPLAAIIPVGDGKTDERVAEGMWKPDAYGVALTRCIVAHKALEPDETAPRILREIHQKDHDRLLEMSNVLCPALLGESDTKPQPPSASESAVTDAQLGLMRYLFDASATVHYSLQHRASAARLLAGFLQLLQDPQDNHETSAGWEALEQAQALPIFIASLSPSWRSLELFVLKAKNGVISAPPSEVQDALVFIRNRAQSMVAQLEGAGISQLRSSTGTLPLAHTLESAAKGDGVDTLIRSLEPYIGLNAGPLDGDLAVRQERALDRAANWVADFFFNQLPVLSSCVPLPDAWFPSAAAVASARRRLLPSPRTDVQLALEVPELALASSLDRIASVPENDTGFVERVRTFLTQTASARIQPDVAVAYQLMSEQPRLASLADWWSVFAQRVSAPDDEGVWTTTASFTAMDGFARSSSPLSSPDEDVEWQGDALNSVASEQAVQARFATALTALHDMGLLAPGARRAEHVARNVFDAPLLQEH